MMLQSIITAAAVAVTSTAFAQASSADHSAHHPPAAAAATTPLSDGEVRKIDKEQGKLTLKHGPIAHLDMPAMTMVFKVADPKMLDKLKPGDKVKFAASSKDGAFTVTAIDLAK